MKDGSGCGGMTGEKSWPVYVIVCIRYNICIYVYYNSTPRGEITIERRGRKQKATVVVHGFIDYIDKCR